MIPVAWSVYSRPASLYMRGRPAPAPAQDRGDPRVLPEGGSPRSAWRPPYHRLEVALDLPLPSTQLRRRHRPWSTTCFDGRARVGRERATGDRRAERRLPDRQPSRVSAIEVGGKAGGANRSGGNIPPAVHPRERHPRQRLVRPGLRLDHIRAARTDGQHPPTRGDQTSGHFAGPGVEDRQFGIDSQPAEPG